MGALTWMTVSWLRHGHPSVLGAAAGAVAGLVGITPASGYVDPLAAIVIGFGAGIACFFAVDLLKRIADDALDVFAVHGVGGIRIEHNYLIGEQGFERLSGHTISLT